MLGRLDPGLRRGDEGSSTCVSSSSPRSRLLATQSAAQAPPPPKLLVVISVDQFSADLFDEYRPQFTGGLARLATGTVFRNGYQSHAATETCPGHSTILTGDHPARTGIIANNWIDQSIAPRRQERLLRRGRDARRAPASTTYKVSPEHLLVPTLGELMKARWPGSRNVAVVGQGPRGGDDERPQCRPALVLDRQANSHRPRGRAGAAGRAEVNAAVAAASRSRAPSRCSRRPSARRGRSRSRSTAAASRSAPAGSRAPPATPAAFRASPEFDGDTLALAAGAGRARCSSAARADPDLLAISLSATDYVGHTYGTEGEEMCLQLLELDREIGDFLAVLDSRGIDYAVALTADHGGNDIPERSGCAGVADAARVDPALNVAKHGQALVARARPSRAGPARRRQLRRHVSSTSACRAARPRARCSTAALAAYRAHPQVEAVFTAARSPRPRCRPARPTNGASSSAPAPAIDPGRSGDFYVVLKRDITPIADTSRARRHARQPWDYDRRVPILFWRPGVTGSTVERSRSRRPTSCRRSPR